MVKVIEEILLVFVLVPLAFTFPWGLPTVTVAWGRYLLALGFLVVFILSAAGMIYGTTVRGIADHIASWLAQRIEKILLVLGEEERHA